MVCSKNSNKNRRSSLNILVARCCHAGAQWLSTPGPARHFVYQHILSAVMNSLSKRSGWLFISSSGKRKKSHRYENILPVQRRNCKVYYLSANQEFWIYCNSCFRVQQYPNQNDAPRESTQVPYFIGADMLFYHHTAVLEGNPLHFVIAF